jgi:hypothetical protein
MRAEGFKIDLLSGRLSAALLGSISAAVFFMDQHAVASFMQQVEATVMISEIGSEITQLWQRLSASLAI